MARREQRSAAPVFSNKERLKAETFGQRRQSGHQADLAAIR